MIGLVIVTHCGLAQEFRSALEHVVGPQGQLETVSIGPDDDAAVRRGQIVDAIQTRGCKSVSKVGACTKAGSNCGSCRPEIRSIIEAFRLQAAE